MLLKKLSGKQDTITKQFFPKKVLIDEKIITNPKIIAEKFNSLFIDIGPKLAQKIEAPTEIFEFYLKKINKRQLEHPLTMNELKEAFFHWKQINVLVMMKLVLMLLRIVLDL